MLYHGKNVHQRLGTLDGLTHELLHVPYDRSGPAWV
jgi:hypothetical protein